MLRLLLLVPLVMLLTPAHAAKSRETERPVTIDGMRCKLWHGFWANGKRWYVHTWCRDKKHGLLVDYNKQGVKVAAVRWKLGYRHGKFERWHANGKLAAVGRYRLAQLIGRLRGYWPNGKRRLDAHYDRDGALDGPYHTFHQSGRPHVSGGYKHGVPEGQWLEHDDGGRIVRRARLSAGALASLAPGPASAPKMAGAYGSKDFALLMAWGSGLHGYDVLRIDARGRAVMTFQRRQLRVNRGQLKGVGRGEVYIRVRAARYTFYLDRKQQRDLRQLLAREKAHAIAPRHVDANVEDGTQWHFKLRLGGTTRRVYCSNQFPPALRRISQYLRGKVLEPRVFEKLLAIKAASNAARDLKL
ncbi:MAG: hypothetical protein KC503_41895 [Myxococcales bacterium]|nr:hypothetical protein [Myxococcales bacterium]